MISMTLYKTYTWQFNKSEKIKHKNKTIGKISQKSRSKFIGNIKYFEYDCTFNEIFEDDIQIEINNVLQSFDEYQKIKKFKVFYFPSKKTLIVRAPSQISNNFIEAVKSCFSQKVNIQGTMNYPFDKLQKKARSMRGLYFSVKQTNISSKHFFGPKVESDKEASKAINNNKATYLMLKIDILKKSRTIGFSKKGTLVLYNVSLKDSYLQITSDVLHAIKLW